MKLIDLPLAGIPLITVVLLILGVSGISHGDLLSADRPLAPRQLLWLVLAVPVVVLGGRIPYRFWRNYAPGLFLVTLVLLITVYFCPPRNGARRWIPLGLLDFQPSELAKFAWLLLLSRYLMYRSNQRRLVGLIPPLLITAIPVVLILREPDLGTALVFLPALFGMLLAAGSRPAHLAMAAVLGMLLLPVLWGVMSAEQRSRVTAVFQQRDDGAVVTGDGYHLHQSKQMLALGGIWGSARSGPRVVDPAAYRLPAARTDFILCLIGERWGLPGTLGVLVLFSLLFLQGLWVAQRCREPFGQLLATGIVCVLATQCLINTAMTVGFAPITGLTLPLMSYGGSNLLMTLGQLALLWNIGLHGTRSELIGEQARGWQFRR